MRHRKTGRHLNRTSSHRTALMRNMCVSLFMNESIRTTLPKAKELRRFAEPLITLAKTDTVAKRQIAFARLRDKSAVAKLFVTISPRYSRRPGGYVRVLKAGYRVGDAAPMAIIQLVEEAMPTPKKKQAKSKKSKAVSKPKVAPVAQQDSTDLSQTSDIDPIKDNSEESEAS